MHYFTHQLTLYFRCSHTHTDIGRRGGLHPHPLPPRVPSPPSQSPTSLVKAILLLRLPVHPSRAKVAGRRLPAVAAMIIRSIRNAMVVVAVAVAREAVVFVDFATW